MILALAGAGGGILAVPLLVFGLHLTLKQAAPVGLIAVGLSAAVGAGLGLRERIVRYRAALLIGGMGMVLAPVGLWLAQRLPNDPLTIGFSVVLAYSGWRSFRLSRPPAEADCGVPGRTCMLNRLSGRINWSLSCAQVLALTGMLSGTLSGMLGAGGGFVIVPALRRYTDLPVRSIMATSLAVIALVSCSGVVSASLSGKVRWDVAIPFGGGAIIALGAGRILSRHIDNGGLMRIFAAVCFGVAGLMVAKGCGLMDL